MFKETTKKHHVVSCDSLGEFTAYSRTLEDHKSSRMPDQSFYGPNVNCLDDVHTMADNGLAREGIEAIALANVNGQDRELKDLNFQTRWDYSGADVDVARYLSGEPENMLAYWTEETEEPQLLAVLVVNICVSCSISDEAFTKHGQSLVALCEAIDGSGMQSEIWADSTIEGKNGYTARFKILLKAPGEVFDPGAFMFGLTHPAMFRGMQLNATYDFPAKWLDPMGVGHGHGRATTEFLHPEDYPEGAIYITAMQRNSDAGKHLPATLKQLGLTT